MFLNKKVWDALAEGRKPQGQEHVRNVGAHRNVRFGSVE